MKKICFLGGGAMGTAMLEGILKKKIVSPKDVVVVEIIPELRQKIETTYGVQTTADASSGVASSDIVVICVKPHMIQKVMKSINPALASNKLYISIAAGVDLQTLNGMLKESHGTRWIRVMPNIACTLGESASSYTPDAACTKADIEVANEILSACGLAVMLADEHLLNAATGVAGSGIAYVFLFIEGLADGGVRAGLPRATALSLAAQTVLGASKMVLSNPPSHPGVLKDAVCSPGGTTIEAVASLERSGLRSAVIEAVTAASQKSIALGEKAKAKAKL
eukprot:TRINITY_DN7893_c0_g1_i1.p1 TRINITY_DN7893_c0_g1~~TRINITY_DN7893_c0_g1_i1.p1  ORF type:complete len:295 (+),score=68.45 TRINITY_DN7893_c0_g1_i1:47-886(+)